MLNIKNTDKLQLVSSAAATLDVVVSGMKYDNDVSPATDRGTPFTQATAFTTASTADILTATGDATIFANAKYITITNTHASLASTVTPQVVISSVAYDLFKPVNLQAGACLQYMEGIGWWVSEVTAPNFDCLSLAGDQSNSTTTLTEVTGLTIPTLVGNYLFAYDLIYQAAASTTGVRFSVNHDGTVTSFVATQAWVSALSTGPDANPDQDVLTATGGSPAAFLARAKSTTGWGTTLTVDTAGADMQMRIFGSLVCSVAGNLELWHGSEVAAASTVKAGSTVTLIKAR